MFNGRLSWIAEAFGGVLLFLLPLKFGTLVAVPSITMIYWSDPVSLMIASWPFPVFPVFAGMFLIVSLLFVPFGDFLRTRFGWLAGLWVLLALAALPGAAAETAPPDGPLYFIDHAFATGAFLTGFALVVRNNGKIAGLYHGIFTASFLISLCIGLNQYFSGYQETISMLKGRNMSDVNQPILARLQEFRVSGCFSACNAFAGYLVLALPVSLAWLWKAGSRFSPPAVSRILFTVPVFLAGVFLLVKTGSRGGILSLLVGVFALLFFSKLSRNKRVALFSLIPLGIAGMTALILLGRGGKSILFRFDYFQGAFRMMAEHPFCGTGWGGFQRQFMKMKWIFDAEAPASPHNFPLTFGSQAGAAGFLISAAILVFSLFFLCRVLSGSSLRENLKDSRILLTGSLCGLAAWTMQSLQDILYETPGAVACYGAIALLAVGLIGPETESEPKKCVPVKITAWCLLLIFAGSTLFIGWKVLSFDSALAALNDMTDYRMLSPEKLALIKESDVADAFENARKRKPDSPYPYLSVGDFYTARGEIRMALKMNADALKQDPHSAAYHMRLYRNYLILGEKEKAKEHVGKAVELFPMNPFYRKHLEEL